jgi:hypothetical protein
MEICSFAHQCFAMPNRFPASHRIAEVHPSTFARIHRPHSMFENIDAVMNQSRTPVALPSIGNRCEEYRKSHRQQFVNQEVDVPHDFF